MPASVDPTICFLSMQEFQFDIGLGLGSGKFKHPFRDHPFLQKFPAWNFYLDYNYYLTFVTQLFANKQIIQYWCLDKGKCIYLKFRVSQGQPFNYFN